MLKIIYCMPKIKSNTKKRSNIMSDMEGWTKQIKKEASGNKKNSGKKKVLKKS